MQTITVGGHRYSDPDVLSLIRTAGEFVDPRAAVLTQAKRLNEEFEKYEGTEINPLERLKILASLCRLDVCEMNPDSRQSERRDAILVPRSGGKGGLIAYNPERNPGRIAFSIAHEIAHTFFPNSTSGARFRTLCNDESREANELERLCDLGASEILMPYNCFRRALGGEFGLQVVPTLSNCFGSSYEATVFRLATTHEGICLAGLLQYRYRMSEQRALAASAAQGLLFGVDSALRNKGSIIPKYRRQSLHASEGCTSDHMVRWNKSFAPTSCVYQAGQCTEITPAWEMLPNEVEEFGNMEAVRAPFQREGDPTRGDVLFLWWQ